MRRLQQRWVFADGAASDPAEIYCGAGDTDNTVYKLSYRISVNQSTIQWAEIERAG